MVKQPNKPGGDFTEDGEIRPVDDEQAVRNQGSVKPEDYPDKADGGKAIGGSVAQS